MQNGYRAVIKVGDREIVDILESRARAMHYVRGWLMSYRDKDVTAVAEDPDGETVISGHFRAGQEWRTILVCAPSGSMVVEGWDTEGEALRESRSIPPYDPYAPEVWSGLALPADREDD